MLLWKSVESDVVRIGLLLATPLLLAVIAAQMNIELGEITMVEVRNEALEKVLLQVAHNGRMVGIRPAA